MHNGPRPPNGTQFRASASVWRTPDRHSGVFSDRTQTRNAKARAKTICLGNLKHISLLHLLHSHQSNLSINHDGIVVVVAAADADAPAPSSEGNASGTSMPATANASRTQAGTGLLGPGNCWARKARTKWGKLPSMMDFGWCGGGVVRGWVG